jgi:UDP-N-acetylmuramyl pentapeptide phosphotransferase/UDP-N-acetylglucosamine-1-phosphate transferase
VSRIGGLGIVGGVVAGVVVIWRFDMPVGVDGLLLLACGLPALIAGLTEDLTKDVSPRRRLLASAMSAMLAVWLLDAVIVRTAIPDSVGCLGSVGAALVSVFVVVGVANTINIIDGFNGLASMCCVLILLCLAMLVSRLMTCGWLGWPWPA